MMFSPYIQPYETINIVSAAWKKSFARPESNQRAISERGWMPFNRNILMYPMVRATMTTEEKQNENLGTSDVTLPFHKLHDVSNCVTLPTFNPDLAKIDYDESKKIPNFGNGAAAWCLDNIVSQQDLMEARSRIRKNRDDGRSLKEKLVESKKITAGTLFKSGSCRIGKTVFDVQKENTKKRESILKEKMMKNQEAYQAMLNEAMYVHSLMLPVEKMTCKQLSAILKPLKTRDDPAMPTKKSELVVRYKQWKDRPIQPMLTTTVSATNVLTTEEGTMTDNEDMEKGEDDVAAAMLQLHRVYHI